MDKICYMELTERFRKGVLTRGELRDFYTLLNSPEGRAQYDLFLREQMDEIGDVTLVADIPSQKMFDKIRKEAGLGKSLNINELLKYAAIITIAVLSAVSGWLLYENNNPPDKILAFSLTKGNKGNMVLPDGTEVWLNSESTILYNAVFQRNIKLNGEAYLNVVKDSKRPFTVNTQFADVKVYGTKFEVTAYSRDSVVSVALVKGSVGIEIDGREKVMLVPGEVISFNARTNELNTKTKDMKDVALWRNEELKLVDVDVKTLCHKMSEWYSLDVMALNAPEKAPKYNMTIRYESIEEMLELVRKITPLKYERNGKEVTLQYTK